ncbi:MAG: TetR/AcrR family transcriptional regulator [Deltaproteobacteria bacterium]|nr:TetR/AcrR family transcriptional regulator [Deltaproteobacteria bacterium]
MTSKTTPQAPRERLLQTASRLFYAQGVANVGIPEIIREAGIARMTLYYHFPSKEDLIREVLTMRVQE